MVKFFSSSKVPAYYDASSPIRSHPNLRHRDFTISGDKTKNKENDKSEGDLDGEEKETKEKETKEEDEEELEKQEVEKDPEDVDEEEDQTKVNTRLNAMLYHVSDDSIDLYRKENTSSDLLGRLYYDDFDSDSVNNSTVNSPLVSPSGTVMTPDYFSLRLGGSGSETNIAMNHAFMALNPGSRPDISRMSSYSGHEMRRIKSFERGISFDTSTDLNRKSMTYKLKHPDFKFRRNNKTFLLGFNEDNESLKAIEWLLDKMVVNGDTVIILQVLDEKLHSYINKKQATQNLARIERLNTHFKKISLVYEIVIGKPQKLLKNAVEEYVPAMMVMGAHDYNEKESHSNYKSIFSKSFSKHFLECALVPVIVVKPSYHSIATLYKPIDSEEYFKDWLVNMDVSSTYSKDWKKRHRTQNHSAHVPSVRSKAAAVSQKYEGKVLNPESHFNKVSNDAKTGVERDESEQDSRGRRPTPSSEKEEGGTKFFLGRSTSRSRSRSLSARRISKIFGH